jgi:pyrimidine operon attenuation protein/uracil phosphoribosyltransferase
MAIIVFLVLPDPISLNQSHNMSKNFILSKEVAEKKMKRMALEIAEQLSEETQPLVLIGIKENGLVIAEKMLEILKPLLSVEVQILSCSMNKKVPTNVTFSRVLNFDNLNVVIVDDVTNSGRTLLYALKPLMDFHPKRVQTLALVERMHKTFPIKPDYVGLSVATTLQEHIQVEVQNGEVTGAYLE